MLTVKKLLLFTYITKSCCLSLLFGRPLGRPSLFILIVTIDCYLPLRLPYLYIGPTATLFLIGRGEWVSYSERRHDVFGLLVASLSVSTLNEMTSIFLN